MAKDNLIRFNLMISGEQVKRIDEYRKDVDTLPAKGLAIRDLIDLGLKKYWETRKGDNHE